MKPPRGLQFFLSVYVARALPLVRGGRAQADTTYTG